MLVRVLVPHRKRGRKPTPQVLTAVRMRARKTPWPEVYAAVIRTTQSSIAATAFSNPASSAATWRHFSSGGAPAYVNVT